jgi:hypothetical protein
MLIDNVWLAIIVWGIIYILDYYLTLYAAHLYQTHLIKFVVFEGSFELTPYFQDDVNLLRRISPRFLFVWIMSFNLLFLIWFLSTRWWNVPWLFSLVYGSLFLREAAVHMRHIRNLTLSLFSRTAGGLKGQIEYSRWLILKLSAVELLSFAGLFLLIYLALGSWLFLGGSISCLYTGLQHWLMSKKVYSTAVIT